MARIGTVPLDLFPGAETFASNFNGGFYAMPAAMARTLGPLWREYATFNLGQADLLGKYLQHSDQLGIGMAVAQSGVPVDLLPFVTNLPTHLPKASLAALAPQAIGALHYHQHLDQHGLPLPVGVNWIDRAITQARQTLTDGRRLGFSNEIFWDFRYDKFPELGSGLGSRDAVLAY